MFAFLCQHSRLLVTAVQLWCAVLRYAVLFDAVPCCVTGGRTSRNKVEVRSFWNALVWLADTILFIWVGIMLAFVLLEPSDQSVRIMGDEFIIQNQLKAIDAAYGLLLYVWLLVSLPICLPYLLFYLFISLLMYAISFTYLFIYLCIEFFLIYLIGLTTPPLSASTARSHHGS